MRIDHEHVNLCVEMLFFYMQIFPVIIGLKWSLWLFYLRPLLKYRTFKHICISFVQWKVVWLESFSYYVYSTL